MRLYIATPINARQGRSLEYKLLAAEQRILTLKQVLKDDPMFEDYDEMVSTFDIQDSSELTEAEAMGNCIAEVLECDAIYLDHGWLQSKGCNLEYRAAKIYGLVIFQHDKL